MEGQSTGPLSEVVLSEAPEHSSFCLASIAVDTPCLV